MTGRHAAPEALTEPMQAIQLTAPMQAVRADDLSDWEAIWSDQNPDTWLAPLRTGGTRTEQRMRATFRERGLLLAKRVSRKALRLRRALAKGGAR